MRRSLDQINNEAAIEHRVIPFYVRQVYGNTLFYPAALKEAIWRLTGKKTLTPDIFKGLEMLGFKFKEVLQPKKEG